VILVTGGAGFIGSHTVRALLARGDAVRVLDDLSTGSQANLTGLDVDLIIGDIADADVTLRAASGCRAAIHLAAKASVPGSCADPLGYDRTNVRGTLAVFEAARQHGLSRVVYASSSAVYGTTDVLPVHEGLPLLPESPYAAGKATAEHYARAYTFTLGLPCTGLRYFNVFGPRQDPAGPYAAVIPRFVEMALQGKPMTIYGDGGQTRDFVSVHDVVRANLLALDHKTSGVFNIGGGRSTTINDLAAAVRAEVPGAGPVLHQPERAGDIRHSLADISAITAALGWTPQADFSAALGETIRWMAQQG